MVINQIKNWLAIITDSFMSHSYFQTTTTPPFQGIYSKFHEVDHSQHQLHTFASYHKEQIFTEEEGR